MESLLEETLNSVPNLGRDVGQSGGAVRGCIHGSHSSENECLKKWKEASHG